MVVGAGFTTTVACVCRCVQYADELYGHSVGDDLRESATNERAHLFSKYPYKYVGCKMIWLDMPGLTVTSECSLGT